MMEFIFGLFLGLIAGALMVLQAIREYPSFLFHNRNRR